MQFQDTISNIGLDISCVKQEFSYMQYLQPTKQRPEYWNNLGSSKSRSAVQEAEAKALIEGSITEKGKDEVFAFTDGSCRGNPGAGACLFFDQQQIELKQPVARHASILLGELEAIKIALEQIKLENTKRRI